MSNGILINASNVLLGTINPNLPQMTGTLNDWFMPMVFSRVTKTVVAGQAVETMTEVNFRGVIQPLKNRDLMLKPEGQRSWTYQWLHAEPGLDLNTDDVITFQGKQTRVVAVKDYRLYGYIEYQLVQDYTGAGPTAVTP